MHRLRRRIETQLSSGFTLIELLVVISIIAILSLVVVTNLQSARTKAQDARISSDVSEVDKALQLVIANNDTVTSLNGVFGSTGFTTLMTVLQDGTNHAPYIPATASVKHPLDPNLKYEFAGKVTNGVLTRYAVCAQQVTPKTTTFFIDDTGSTSTSGTDLCAVALP